MARRPSRVVPVVDPVSTGDEASLPAGEDTAEPVTPVGAGEDLSPSRPVVDEAPVDAREEEPSLPPPAPAALPLVKWHGQKGTCRVGSQADIEKLPWKVARVVEVGSGQSARGDDLRLLPVSSRHGYDVVVLAG